MQARQQQGQEETMTGLRAHAPSGRVWAGRVLSGLVVLFLVVVSAVPKLFIPDVSGPVMTQLEWPAERTLLVAVLELTGALLYALPRTAVLGATMLTGLFGGAAAAHLRIGNPLLSHVLFSVYLGCMVWGALWLRDDRVRALLPIVSRRS